MGCFDELKIHLIERDRSLFVPKGGLNLEDFVDKWDSKICNFKDYCGEYYIKPERFGIDGESVYKKKQMAGEIPAEIILAYAYNLLGLPSPIAYPYFMKSHLPGYILNHDAWKNSTLVPTGVVTRDVREVFPTAVHRMDRDCHTIKGLFTSDNCSDIAPTGKMDKVKDTIASIAFNDKDSGYDNSYWLRDSAGNHTGVVPIDHGYSGRDSMYLRPYDKFYQGLYMVGEHGYNGMFCPDEDRGTTMYFLKKLLAGEEVCGVKFSDNQIKELNRFIHQIKQLSFDKIADAYNDRYNYKVSPKYLESLKWSRDDLCGNLLERV
ncbi:MAG: hypothetical protein E7356_01655 [Clostridiales bacterium]|nr:hypothetical protein [Clostridiales bacterium]